MQGNGKVSQDVAVMLLDAATTLEGTATTPQGTVIMASHDAAIALEDVAMPLEDAATAPQPPAQSQRNLDTYHKGAGMEQRLLRARGAIEAVLGDPELQSMLALWGYDQARMMQGKELCDQAEELIEKLRARTGEQRGVTEARDTAQAEAHTYYMRIVTLARIALRDERGLTKSLGLHKPRKRKLEDWLRQAREFYSFALYYPPILDKLAVYRITREQLEHGQSLVMAVADNMDVRYQHKWDKRRAMRERDSALKALDSWIQDFKTVARIALGKQPQMLEKLGIFGPSSRAR